MSLLHFHAGVKTRFMVSDIGIAESNDGFTFADRRRFIIPEYDWEKFGCEDPRVTKLDNAYYIFYTALSAWPPRAADIKIGVAVSKTLKTVQEKHLVTPFNAKAMALFPERINGKLRAVLTVHTDRPPAQICIAAFDKPEDMWSRNYWERWYKHVEDHVLPLQRRAEDHVEIGAPPVKTRHGWLLFYSYIRNYFSEQRLFGIEAVLLDLKDPTKIIGRTAYPILTPEAYYERFGMVPNTIFPSGAVLKDGWVYLYYGAADTTCAVVRIGLASLLDQMLPQALTPAQLARAAENPIIAPDVARPWEAKSAFNAGAVYLGGKVHLLYRAVSPDNTSVLGYAASGDGIHIDERLPDPVYVPREPFEKKAAPNVNSGCEDPRLTHIGKKIYLCYTAFDGKHPPRVALAWITENNFLRRNWAWSAPVLLSPPDFDDKDALVFPAKVRGKYMIVHRVGEDIDYGFLSTLQFRGNQWLEEHRWITPRKGWWDSKRVGAAAPPIKTRDGWVMLYHGISDDGVYRVGATLLDLTDPTKIIGRTDNPIFEPEAAYEKEGLVPNVVFPCGAVVIDGTLFMYYGGADTVVGVATMKLEKLLGILEVCKC